MAADNPYAPPGTATEGVRVKGEPESYWVSADKLYLIDGAILPDVCLETGEVEGEMIRGYQVFWRQLKPNHLYLCVVLIVGGGLLKVPFLPWLLLLALITFFYLRRSINAQVCYTKGAGLRKRSIRLAKWGFVIVAMVFLGWSNFDPENRLLAAFVIALAGIGFVGKFDRSCRVVRIKKKVAVLDGVHPEALRQLHRWRKAHLPKAAPDVIDI